ncbi:MAG TPA: FkbM family methyltransferase [Gemmataceae bacterium]|nr:FkbM family methyltransferase [Gemmataceae bacterium]
MSGERSAAGRPCPVVFAPGVAFTVFLDPTFDDPIDAAFAAGEFNARHLCDLVLRLSRRGGRVLDLGAHHGTIALTAAAAGRHVLAVEASPRNVELLRQSAAANGFDCLKIVHAAAGAAAGVADFTSYGPWGHVGKPQVNVAPVPVRVAAVDDLLQEVGWDTVDVIKMDIEGSEPAAVEGMKRLLSRPDAPALIYECNAAGLATFGRTVNELKAELAHLGYQNYWIEPSAQLPFFRRQAVRIARRLGRGAMRSSGGCLTPVEAADPQPEFCVDYLAVKRRPAGLGFAWWVRPPLSREEIVARVVQTCSDSPAPQQCVYLAQMLAAWPAWLRDDDRIRRAVDGLFSQGLPGSAPPPVEDADQRWRRGA